MSEIVSRRIYPNLEKYKNEHHPSLGGARFLCKRIAEIEMEYGCKLEGKYLLNNSTK